MNYDALRWGKVAALVGGAAWCALSLLSLATPDPARYLDVLFLIPFSLTLLAFLGLDSQQRDQTGSLGRVFFVVSAVAMVAVLIGQVGIIADVDALEILSFPLGAATWFVGFALYGIATFRARLLPRWIGAAIALSQPLTALVALAFSPISPVADHGDFSGTVAHGVIWLAIGGVLRIRSLEESAVASQLQAGQTA